MSSRASGRPGAALLAGILLFCLTVASQFVVATYGEAPAPPPVRVDDVPASQRARLRVVDSVPVVRLQGTPYEMGKQHGQVLRRQIHFLFKEYYEAMMVRAVGRARLHEWAVAVEPYIPERYREEMRGLAEGSGLSYEQVLRCNAALDRFQSVFCSTVVAAGEATKDGDVVFGRNLDFPGHNVLNRMTVVIVFEPKGGTPLAAVTWPGLIGTLSGMNAEGVAGATMMITHGGAAEPGIPYTIMYRDALATARRAGDVFEYIRKAKRTCANNFMVADADGRSEVVEFTAKKAARREATADCVCSTNFFQTKALRDVGFRLGEDRYETLTNFLASERGSIDVDKVKAALGRVAMPALMNVQSMVFLPRRRAMHVAQGGDTPVARRPFVFLSRERLFGAPREGK